jgi:flagellar biosynthesis/type III secretory pathway chaperone
MSVNQGLWADLQLSLQQDSSVTTALKELLEHERSALENREYQAFKERLAEKQQLLLQLDNNSKQRQKLLKQLGFGNEEETLQAALQQAPAVAQSWQALTQHWQECQELNEINDRISQRTRLVVGQMLDLLRGQNGDNRTYTAKGGTKNHSSGRPITSA